MSTSERDGRGPALIYQMVAAAVFALVLVGTSGHVLAVDDAPVVADAPQPTDPPDDEPASSVPTSDEPAPDDTPPDDSDDVDTDEAELEPSDVSIAVWIGALLLLVAAVTWAVMRTSTKPASDDEQKPLQVDP